MAYRKGPRRGGRKGRRESPHDRQPDRRRPRERGQGVVHRGRVGEVGLDGRLRVWLDPLDVGTALALSSRGGADVLTARQQRIGTVERVVGSLQSPIAVVSPDRDVREQLAGMRGREVFLG